MKLLPIALFGAVIGCASASAAETHSNDVAFDDYGAVSASLTGQPGDPVKGAEIIVTKSKGNCIACHEITPLKDAPFHGEVGPMLDGAGDRWTEAEMRGLVVNAKMTFDGTVMPAFYKTKGFIRPGDAYTGKAAKDPDNMTPILTAQEIEDVVAYLLTLKEQ